MGKDNEMHFFGCTCLADAGRLIRRALRFAFGLALAAGTFSAALADEAPEAPTIKFRGYINGTLFVIVGREHTYATGTAPNLQVQLKAEGAAESQYVTVSDKPVTDWRLMYSWTEYNGAQWLLKTNYLNAVDVRCRFVLNGVASAWSDVGPITSTLNVSGTPIIDSSNTSLINRPYDANLDNDGIVDVSTSDPWVGMSFDNPTRIRGIRFTTRPDGSRDRYNNSIFEAASDATFGDAVTVHTCRNDFDKDVAPLGIDEVYFDEPITCGAIRHRLGVREQTAEIEFIPADPPWRAALTVEPCDYTNFHAVVRWTIPDELFATKSRLLRRRGSARAYAPVTDWMGASGELCVTNADLLVAGDYQYAVEVDCNHPYFTPCLVTNETAVSYRRLRQLERSSDDQTKLRTGVTVLTCTNGTVYTALNWCFDGDPSTFPDLYTPPEIARGPVGVNFGENVWVAGFGYICRPGTSSYSSSRITLTSLFCASGSDAELSDRVRCSDRPTRSSTDATFYYEPGTFIPDAGAPCWFLWDVVMGGNAFCCNVAEVMFYGWTQDDLDAMPDLVEPSSLTFVRSAAGVDVTWSGDLNATSFALERRMRGESAWTTVASGLTTHTYRDANLATGTYEYRVTASNAEESLSSAAFTCIYYVPGDGTGLRNTVWAPYGGATGADYRQYGSVSSRGVEAVDLDLNEPPVPGLTGPARLIWSGRLTVPFAGDCRLTLQTAAGGQIEVDGTVVAAKWVPGATELSGVINLTAGEHAIRVDCRMADGVSDRVLAKLLWGGVMPEEIIPASQLKPDDTTLSPIYGDWRLVNFQQIQLGSVTPIDGGWRLTASYEKTYKDTLRTSDNLTYLWREASGPFVLKAHVQHVSHGLAQLMVRNAAGDYYAVSFLSEYAEYSVGAVSLLPGASARTTDYWSELLTSFKSPKGWLKLDYRRGRLTGTFTPDETGEEIEVFTWTDGVEATLGGTFAVGFGVTGCTPASAVVIPKYDFTDVTFKSRAGCAVFLK